MSDNNWLKDKLEKMDGKLDKTDTRLDSVHDVLLEQAVTLAKQSVILEDHTRRSLANEEAVEILKRELKPIQSERYMIKGAIKLGGILIGAAGVLAGFVKWIFHIYR